MDSSALTDKETSNNYNFYKQKSWAQRQQLLQNIVHFYGEVLSSSDVFIIM